MVDFSDRTKQRMGIFEVFRQQGALVDAVGKVDRSAMRLHLSIHAEELVADGFARQIIEAGLVILNEPGSSSPYKEIEIVGREVKEGEVSYKFEIKSTPNRRSSAVTEDPELLLEIARGVLEGNQKITGHLAALDEEHGRW